MSAVIHYKNHFGVIISISRLKLFTNYRIVKNDFGVIISISRLKPKNNRNKNTFNFGVIISISRLKPKRPLSNVVLYFGVIINISFVFICLVKFSISIIKPYMFNKLYYINF